VEAAGTAPVSPVGGATQAAASNPALLSPAIRKNSRRVTHILLSAILNILSMSVLANHQVN
jgi:hypothetical protein